MKDLRLYIIIATLFFGLYLVAQYNKPQPVDWRETFDHRDKIPFGTYILYNRLNDLFPGSKIKALQQAPYITLRENEAAPGAYVIIAQSAKIDRYDFKELEIYMLKGNDVFIAAYYLGQYIEDSLKTKINSEGILGSNKKMPLRFVSPSLNPAKWYEFDKGIGDQYFTRFDTSRAEVLGKNKNDHPNFLRYRYGKGNLYIITSPFFFSNYNLLNTAGADYASKALSYIKPQKEIIWDEFSSLGAVEESPLSVFFRYTSLRHAYYTALFSLLIFVVYEMKRRQRIIPVMEPLRNTSADFVTTVGRLYYRKRNHVNLADKKVSYFLEDIRSKYNLRTNTIDTEFAEMLVKKSGVSKMLALDLVRQIVQLRKYSNMSDQELIDLNKNIEAFYQQSQ